MIDVWDSFSHSPPAFRMKMLVLKHSKFFLWISHNFVSGAQKHRFLVTADFRSICTIHWLNKIGGIHTSTFTVSNNFKWFQFCGQRVHAIKIAYLIAKLHNYSEKAYNLRQVGFVIPSILMFCSVGLDTSWNMPFIVKIRGGANSHIFSSSRQAYFLLLVLRAIWLHFEPVSTWFDSTFIWTNYKAPQSIDQCSADIASMYIWQIYWWLNIFYHYGNLLCSAKTCLSKIYPNYTKDSVTRFVNHWWNYFVTNLLEPSWTQSSNSRLYL